MLDTVTGRTFNSFGIVDCLNELETKCHKLEKENEQLRTQLLICQQSKNDDGRFQVWEVPPIPKGMRVSFTTSDGAKDE